MAKALVDVAELNLLAQIAERMNDAGHPETGKDVMRIVKRLRKFVDLGPKPAEFKQAPDPLPEIHCSFEGCKNTEHFINIAPPLAQAPDWRCPAHLPEGVVRPGFPHSPFRDQRIFEAWQNYFRTQKA